MKRESSEILCENEEFKIKRLHHRFLCRNHFTTLNCPCTNKWSKRTQNGERNKAQTDRETGTMRECTQWSDDGYWTQTNYERNHYVFIPLRVRAIWTRSDLLSAIPLMHFTRKHLRAMWTECTTWPRTTIAIFLLLNSNFRCNHFFSFLFFFHAQSIVIELAKLWLT